MEEEKKLKRNHAYELTIKAYIEPPRGIYDLGSFRGWIIGYLKGKDMIFDLESIVLKSQDE